jgi:dsRNA-specific ribonuclease
MVAAFVPSIMHKLDGVFLAQDLQSTALRDIHINDLSLLKEAISSPSAGEKADYNRLEFLGDSILKFCASLQIIAQHLNWPEGYLSKGKYVIVSNNFLTKAALDVGLDRFVLTEKFTGRKWRPPTIDALLTAEDGGSRRLSSKVVADVVEALIGAAYVDGGLPKAFTCIRELLPGQQWFSHSEATDRLLSDVTPIGRLDLQLLERLVGHDFMHKSLLLEAVTHASSSSNPTVPSYERLEFLGDAILDLIIVPKIFAHNNRLRHWELARVHSALVAGDFLGYCCMSYGIGEETQNVVVEVSDQGKHLPLLRSATRRVHLYDFLQAGPQLLGHKLNSLEAFQKHHGAVDEALECGKDYPWPDLIAMRPQKFFSDLIESVLGALFLDTQGDLAVCEAFVEKLGIFKIMRRILDERVETASPKERVGILAGEKSVEYIATQTESGEERFGCACTVVVDGEEVAHAEECSSKDEAKARAAFEAVKILQARLEEEVKLEGGGSRKKRKLELRPVETEQPALQLDDVDMDVDGGAVLLADDKDD